MAKLSLCLCSYKSLGFTGFSTIGIISTLKVKIIVPRTKIPCNKLLLWALPHCHGRFIRRIGKPLMDVISFLAE